MVGRHGESDENRGHRPAGCVPRIYYDFYVWVIPDEWLAKYMGRPAGDDWRRYTKIWKLSWLEQHVPVAQVDPRFLVT